jgi:hypothetical protein
MMPQNSGSRGSPKLNYGIILPIILHWVVLHSLHSMDMILTLGQYHLCLQPPPHLWLR